MGQETEIEMVCFFPMSSGVANTSTTCTVTGKKLTLKAPITTAADDIHKIKYFSLFFKENKT